MNKLGICTGLVVLALAMLFGSSYGAAAGGKTIVRADTLTGYQEATPAGVSSPGTGSFVAVIDENTSTIQFELTYVGLTAPATVAHIHFGNRFTSGGVSVFFCGGGGRPACPPGTTVLATVSGIITAADVGGPAAQGIAAGEIGELIRAIRAGVTYVNVHNANFPQREIRGQVNDDNQRQP
jgi:CHRD domain-containing protein